MNLLGVVASIFEMFLEIDCINFLHSIGFWYNSNFICFYVCVCVVHTPVAVPVY